MANGDTTADKQAEAIRDAMAVNDSGADATIPESQQADATIDQSEMDAGEAMRKLGAVPDETEKQQPESVEQAKDLAKQPTGTSQAERIANQVGPGETTTSDATVDSDLTNDQMKERAADRTQEATQPPELLEATQAGQDVARGPPETIQELRQRQAQRLSQETGVDYTASDIDVERTGGELQIGLTERGKQRRRRQLREDFAQDIRQRTGAGIYTGDVTVNETEVGGFTLGLSESAGKRVQTRQQQAQALSLLGAVPEGTERQIQSEQAPAAWRQLSALPGDAPTTKSEAPALLGAVPDRTQERQSAQQEQLQQAEEDLEQDVVEELGMPGWEAGEDTFQIERTRQDGGTQLQARLTDRGRKRYIKTQAAQEGELVIDERGKIVNIGDGVEAQGETRSIQIKELDQLQFNDEGELVDVEGPDTSESELDRLREWREGITPELPGVLGDWQDSAQEETPDDGLLIRSRQIVEGAGDIGVQAGETFQTEAVEPSAEFLGENPGAAFPPLLGPQLAADAAGVDYEPVGTAVEKYSTGVGSVGTIALESPELVAAGSDVAGRSAAFAVQNPPKESAAAAADETGYVAERVVEQSTNNPIRTVGTLAGSAGLIGAAGRVSPTAGRASSAAIQPGVEAATAIGRRVAPRTMQRIPGGALGPEEIVLGSIARGARATKEAARRTRIRTRPGVGLGSIKIETDPDSGRAESGSGEAEITGSDIATDVDTSPGKLPGNEGAGRDTSEPTAGGDAWPDYMLPEGHPMRSDTAAEPVRPEAETGGQGFQSMLAETYSDARSRLRQAQELSFTPRSRLEARADSSRLALGREDALDLQGVATVSEVQQTKQAGRQNALDLQESAMSSAVWETATGQAGDQRMERISNIRQRNRSRPRSRLGTDFRQKVDTPQRTDFGTRLGLDLDTPLRPDIRTPRTPPTRFPPMDKEDASSSDRSGFNLNLGADRGSADSQLAPGWLSETITAIATQGTATAPSDETLEEQPTSQMLTGELPTAEMLDPETSGDVQSVVDLLTGQETDGQTDIEEFDLGIGFGGEES